ncbi:NAD(P)H dehydrogenase [quinone] 1-like [Notothenia coriiceps]|uniref:NAD(P)H dehydrogenase [quinone] 1-like n=1 Tax=Notothenia coriiceps TaxID=8208 RepID=A0A6I9Q5L5_9TELE|nr:PREDICTED: NAD(P)H dehydrogenase [quinone] 1-like [Notothenia coriiceps]
MVTTGVDIVTGIWKYQYASSLMKMSTSANMFKILKVAVAENRRAQLARSRDHTYRPRLDFFDRKYPEVVVEGNLFIVCINTLYFVFLPLQNGILHYCGFQVLAPQIFWAPSHVPSEARGTMLEGWRTRMQGLLGENPLAFTPLDCFDGEKGYQLKPEVHEKHAAKEFGLTVGIHLGKALPPNNQMKAGV